MQCPKCKKNIPENAAVCPHCKKVLYLECPNCHSIGDSPTCENCGYIILTKCSKCGKTVSTTQTKCKCGFPVKTSVAYQECETDEFASVVVQFNALKNIKNVLGSKELFSKFVVRLKNLMTSQLNGVEGKIINYNNVYIINFNKELSLATSANKAVRFAIKIANAFSNLNNRVLEELGTSLKLSISIIKKDSENLLEKMTADTNVKLLTVKKNEPKFLKGMQIILDHFIWDCVNKEYKTDSLFSVEHDGVSLMYYEILLENYVIPPSEKSSDEPIAVNKQEIVKSNVQQEEDVYSFKCFDINAKCKFEKTNAVDFFSKYQNNWIVSICSEKEHSIASFDLIRFFESKGRKVLHVTCSEELNYKPWGVLEQIFKEYYNLSEIQEKYDLKHFQSIVNLIQQIPAKAASPEDARFRYIEDFSNFLKSLKNCTIIIENFEYIDDTTIQTLKLYFDKFQNINVQFVFTGNGQESLHSKIKGLLRTSLYSEYTLLSTPTETILSEIKEDATDFIQSFFFEKIKEYYNGSLLYFKHAMKYLFDKNIIISFENKLVVKNKQSAIIPSSLYELIKIRLKDLNKNNDASMILAFSVYLGAKLDFEMLNQLGIQNLEKTAEVLVESGFCFVKDNALYINNYSLIKSVMEGSLKPEVNEFLVKHILSKIGKKLAPAPTALLMGKISLFKEEYLVLWKNSGFSMKTGDYDAYLKNCLGFMALLEHIEDNIEHSDIEENKKEVFQNILLNLYNYSPEKIYSIENVLLVDAFNENNDEKIVKLSNLMLQGALLSSNYTNASSLLHNIFARIPNPTLITDGKINTKFLLLSLVNIEILFNIGDFAECIEIAEDLLKVISPEIIEKIKPASFSVNSFKEHIMETMRIAAFAKLLLFNENIEDFILSIESALGMEMPEKDCIITIREFLNGKSYSSSNVESASPFSKIIYLILQEFQEHSNDYKTFAQNIYQAKLLAADIHQKQLELFCDLLIGYSYASMGISQKAKLIYNDILEKSENSAIFNISMLAKYFMAVLNMKEGNKEKALLTINDVLAIIQKQEEYSKIFFVMFEKLFIDIIKSEGLNIANIETEEMKLNSVLQENELSRLL